MNPTMTAIPATGNWQRPARFGYLVIFLTFVVGGGWVAVAKVNSAVVAPAIVAIESNRKLVQHLEGGIVSAVLIKEGQHVGQEQVVLRLNNVQAMASMLTVQNQLATALVQEARQLAERDRKSEITFPPEITAHKADPIVADAIADQTATFEDHRRSLEGQISVLQARIQGSAIEMKGLGVEEQATREQVGYIEQELIGLHQLLAGHLVPVGRVLAQERERSRLNGVIGRLIADQAKARNSIGETQLDIQELSHKFQEETAASILEVRQRIADLREKVSVTADITHRIDITAPVSGTVQGLKVYAVGQVIRPGEQLMEVVPDEEKLVVHAQFQPVDIDRVHRAREVEVRFPSFHARTTPVILGYLESVSEDRLTDESTHQGYYLGIVVVNKLRIPEELRGRLRAGMPAEVIAPLDDRTVLSYLVSPLAEAWHKSLREQ